MARRAGHPDPRAARPGAGVNMDAKLMTALCFFFTASPVLAEEVLYCTDTAIVGFKWNGDVALPPGKFTPDRTPAR